MKGSFSKKKKTILARAIVMGLCLCVFSHAQAADPSGFETPEYFKSTGLDIINVISREMGMTAPIWLDGAESVVKYLPVEAQTIQLAVDGGSEQLRVYVEE